MSTHHPHLHGADPHVNAAANAADRANRPTLLLALSIVAFVGMAAWLAVTLVNVQVARGDAASERARQARVITQINEIRNLQAASPSISDVYPPAGAALLMPNHLRDVARRVWDLRDGPLDPIVTIPSSPDTAPLASADGLGRADVMVRITNQPLEKILEFVESALEYEFLSSAFVLEFDLTPRRPSGWSASIIFRRYTAAG